MQKGLFTPFFSRQLKPWILILSAGISPAFAQYDSAASPSESTTQYDAQVDFTWWENKRNQRQRELDRYLTDNNLEFQQFKDVPVGNAGIPAIMLRVFPLLFPEIWGEPDAYFAPVGLGPDPFAPNKTFPLGIGISPSGIVIPVPVGDQVVNVDIQVTQLTCMACHAGRVETSDGSIQTLIGAPNNQFDRFRYRATQTVSHVDFTADQFRQAIATAAAAGPGWLYPAPAMGQQEALETALFLSPGVAENFVTSLRQRVLAMAQRTAKTLLSYSYAGDNAPDFNGPQAGLLDAYGVVSVLVLDPDVLTPEEIAAYAPPKPALVDIMSTWLQQDRPLGQWDGSAASPVHRNVASSLGVVSLPSAVDVNNAIVTTDFVQALPPPPYPFAVDKGAADKGKILFKRHCSSCHYAGADEIYSPDYVGTDPNRVNVLSDYTASRLASVIGATCPDFVLRCNTVSGEAFNADEILRITGGYQALPLDGIWARAPYLHNGSVPTLAALLTGERPPQFYRGNVQYDQVNVGFQWDRAISQYASLYDTRLDGFSNAGHSGPEFNGPLDWANEPEALRQLLEYLKTL